MPNSDFRDRFVYPVHKLMIDSYSPSVASMDSDNDLTIFGYVCVMYSALS